MRGVTGFSVLVALGALAAWRSRRTLAPYWRSFRTFSAPSAGLYDVLAERLLARMYSRILRDLKNTGVLGGSVLDLGCGPGHLAIAIAGADPSVEVIGVDVSPDMVTLAKHKTSAEGLGDRVDFRLGDAGSLPFPEGRFDLVMSSLSLHHWPDPARGLREIHHVLKPGGRAVIYDVAKWLMHVERQGSWLDELASTSPFPAYSLESVWGVGPVSVLWRLSLDVPR